MSPNFLLPFYLYDSQSGENYFYELENSIAIPNNTLPLIEEIEKELVSSSSNLDTSIIQRLTSIYYEVIFLNCVNQKPLKVDSETKNLLFPRLLSAVYLYRTIPSIRSAIAPAIIEKMNKREEMISLLLNKNLKLLLLEKEEVYSPKNISIMTKNYSKIINEVVPLLVSLPIFQTFLTDECRENWFKMALGSIHFTIKLWYRLFEGEKFSHPLNLFINNFNLLFSFNHLTENESKISKNCITFLSLATCVLYDGDAPKKTLKKMTALLYSKNNDSMKFVYNSLYTLKMKNHLDKIDHFKNSSHLRHFCEFVENSCTHSGIENAKVRLSLINKIDQSQLPQNDKEKLVLNLLEGIRKNLEELKRDSKIIPSKETAQLIYNVLCKYCFSLNIFKKQDSIFLAAFNLINLKELVDSEWEASSSTSDQNDKTSLSPILKNFIQIWISISKNTQDKLFKNLGATYYLKILNHLLDLNSDGNNLYILQKKAFKLLFINFFEYIYIDKSITLNRCELEMYEKIKKSAVEQATSAGSCLPDVSYYINLESCLNDIEKLVLLSLGDSLKWPFELWDRLKSKIQLMKKLNASINQFLSSSLPIIDVDFDAQTEDDFACFIQFLIKIIFQSSSKINKISSQEYPTLLFFKDLLKKILSLDLPLKDYSIQIDDNEITIHSIQRTSKKIHKELMTSSTHSRDRFYENQLLSLLNGQQSKLPRTFYADKTSLNASVTRPPSPPKESSFLTTSLEKLPDILLTLWPAEFSPNLINLISNLFSHEITGSWKIRKFRELLEQNELKKFFRFEERSSGQKNGVALQPTPWLTHELKSKYASINMSEISWFTHIHPGQDIDSGAIASLRNLFERVGFRSLVS